MDANYPDITITPEVLSGSPRINGRRLAVGDVVEFLNGYGTLTEVAKEYDLSGSQIDQALRYCSSLQCKTDKPLVFCHNCSLRREQDGPVNTSNMEEVTIDSEKFVKDDNSIYLGSMNEFLSQAQGKNYWLIATDLLIDLRTDLKKLREG